MSLRNKLSIVAVAVFALATVAMAGLPNPGMAIEKGRTALLITDPQNDFLSPDGVTWGLVGNSVTANGTVENIESLMQIDFLSPEGVTWGVVGESVTENNTVENIDRLFRVAKAHDIPVFVSPHYYFPTNHGWHFEGALEKLMHTIGMFDRKGQLDTEGFQGSGADWLEQYKPYIEDGVTVITSPHKVYGHETNDLVLQLRKRGIDKVIIAGMSANLCTESHMRELIEQGFEVAVVKDATAGAIVPEGDGYQAALVNFRFIASAVWTTQEAVAAIETAVASR